MSNKDHKPHLPQDIASERHAVASTAEPAPIERLNVVRGEALVAIARVLARQAARDFFHARIAKDNTDER